MSAQRILVFATALLIAGPLAPAQTGRTATSARRVSRPPSTQDERKLVFLSGHVTLDDGMPPPERVAIERVCNGRTRREAYSDSHGAFSFQLGGESEMLQDASTGGFDGIHPPGTSGSSPRGNITATTPSTPVGGVSQRELLGCELRAVLGGFVSDSINLAGRGVSDNPDVGTIVLHRMEKVEGTKISVTTLQAPSDAKKAFDRARHALAKNKPAAAERELRKAVALYPKFAEALSQLGGIYFEQGRNEEAAKLFEAAIEADPKFVGPYYNLGLLAAEERDWKRMAEWSDKALALDPYEFPVTYLMNAIANYNLQNLDSAEKSAHTARRLDSQHRLPRIDFILANVLMQRGDYAGAAEQLRLFLKYQPTGSEAEAAREMLGLTQQRIASGPAPGPK